MPLGPFKLGEFLRILGIDRPLQARVLALGLSQIYGFVRQSLGELDIRSQPGEGAIIDFIMPGMNGAEVGRRVHERLPGLPIVFISGYADTDALRGVAGAVILRKPSRSWTCSRWSLASCTDCGGVSGSTAEAGDHDKALTPGRPSPKAGRPLHMGGKVLLARTHHVWTVASIQTPDIPP